MTYFYKGEFVDYVPNDDTCVYFYGDSNNLYVNFYGCLEHFIRYVGEYNIYYDLGRNSVEISTYCMLLKKYLSDHFRFPNGTNNNICGLYKDTLIDLANKINITYHHYIGTCRNTLDLFEGGSNTKSAK